MTVLGSFRMTSPGAGPVGRRAPVWALVVAYLVVSVLDVVAEGVGADPAAFVLRLLAMPLLISAFIAARPRFGRTTVLVLGALLLSWLGDTVGDSSEQAKILLFLLAQLLYIGAFWPLRHRSLLRRPAVVGLYLLSGGAIAAAMITRAGGLAVPVAVYALSLVTMAVLSSGVARRAAFGGILFLISDSLLGLSWFYPDLPVAVLNVVIMLTYLSAQGLLAWGVLRADRRGRLPG